VDALVGALADEFDSVEGAEFLRGASLAAHELPRRLRERLVDFKRAEPQGGVLLLSGWPIDERRIGPTPASWNARRRPSPTLREEIYMLVLSSLLGDSIAWATQQDGHLVHDILPMQGYEHEQLGFGSEELLWWHTEDAFHPFRGDYLGMLCLRNPDEVATTVAALDNVDIPHAHRRLLFERCFKIKPDESHLPKNRHPERQLTGALGSSYEQMEQRSREPERVAVLFGGDEAPYLRLDPFFMERLTDNPAAQEALDALCRSLDRNLQDLVLRPGDLCFIDNFRAVHGRKPFRARYDGKDRWLKRINVARDLRKSREQRASSTSPVLM
jgi:Fe(II)/alpha-ketoglutarate-dependent arginine beta-hydroxylase